MCATALALGLAPTGSLAAKAVRAAPPKRRPVVDYSRRAEVLDYIDERVAQDGFDRTALLRLFAAVRFSEISARLMLPAAIAARRDWNAYRARFVEPVRIAGGFDFWNDNAALLERAEREYGVPAAIIVGILGVETVYGRNTGSVRVIDALTTLAFDFPDQRRDRSRFFREQLTDLLVLARANGTDLATLRGSYAGAIGMPQFMPGSMLRYAIDADGDGVVDLVGSPADVVASVANFLVQHGWVRGLATHVALTPSSEVDPSRSATVAAMVAAGSEPRYDIVDFVAAGFEVASPRPDVPYALIDLPCGDDAVAWLAGTQNFHVVTRYNRSYFYAYSVIELGATIAALRTAQR